MIDLCAIADRRNLTAANLRFRDGGCVVEYTQCANCLAKVRIGSELVSGWFWDARCDYWFCAECAKDVTE